MATPMQERNIIEPEREDDGYGVSSRTAAESTLFKMVNTLIHILEAKDPFMEYHSEKVTRMSNAIGREMGLKDQELIELQMGALLHDIGNLGVRDHVLQKRGSLNRDEWDHMMSHTEIGASLLRDLFAGTSVLDIVKYHHEHFNGNGRYNLRDESIPLSARIVAVADSFDAMTSARPYRPAKTTYEAVQELRRAAGAQFDPAVVKAFVEIITRDMDDYQV